MIDAHDPPRDSSPAVAPTVVLGTRNRGKVREIVDLFGRAGLRLHLITIDQIAPAVELREDRDTFEGNALDKARQTSLATGLPALADDSGLEVDALGGAPGVWSARYAGEPCDDDRNNQKLLRELAAHPQAPRTARYRCVAAFVDAASDRELSCAGTCEGVILEAPRGAGGFGYDPLFYVPARGRTMAELDLADKNGLSHRGAAFTALARALAAEGILT